MPDPVSETVGVDVLGSFLGDLGGASVAAEGATAAADIGATLGAADVAGATAGTLMPAAVPAADPTFGGALAPTAPGVFEAGAPIGAPPIGAVGTGGTPSPGPSILTSSSPMVGLDPTTAAALGVDSPTGFMPGGAPTFGEGSGLAPGDYNVGTSGTASGADYGLDTAAGSDPLGSTAALLKKLGLTPATAGLLGISGLQALSNPKLPGAAKTLQGTAGSGATAATGVIQSGGTSGPAWATQKASIDATIDQQLKEQTAAMMQQAVNSGQGADSQVTQQQVNKIKNQAETMRQEMYAKAQAQNVQAALAELGISDAALSNVANTQFQQSAAARQGAAQTASLALMLSVLGKG